MSHGDPTTDGQVSATFENDTISCICLIYAVTVFPRSPEGSMIGSTIGDNSPRYSPSQVDPCAPSTPIVVDMSGSEGDGYAWLNPLSWFGSEPIASSVTQDHSPPPPPPPTTTTVNDMPVIIPHITLERPTHTSTPRSPHHSSEAPVIHMPAVKPAPVVATALPSIPAAHLPVAHHPTTNHNPPSSPMMSSTTPTLTAQETREGQAPRSAVLVPAAFAAALTNKQSKQTPQSSISIPTTPSMPTPGRQSTFTFSSTVTVITTSDTKTTHLLISSPQRSLQPYPFRLLSLRWCQKVAYRTNWESINCGRISNDRLFTLRYTCTSICTCTYAYTYTCCFAAVG